MDRSLTFQNVDEIILPCNNLSMAQESFQNKRKKDSLFFPLSFQNPPPLLKLVAHENNFLHTRVLLQVFHITCGTKTPNNLEHRNLLMYSKPQEVPEQIPLIPNCHSRILNFKKSQNSNLLLKVKEKCTNADACTPTYMHTQTYISTIYTHIYTYIYIYIYIYIPMHIHIPTYTHLH